MSDLKQARIAIVGGGIGGLVLAVALGKCGATFDIDIYESASSFTEIGAGIVMWPRVEDILKTLGLGDNLGRRRTHTEGDEKMAYYKADETELAQCGQTHLPMQSYHRADILKSLEENIPPGYRTHFGKRLQSYEDSVPGPVTLWFEDGSSATCDILIGADGIKSAVRKSMFTHLASNAKDEDEAAAYRQWVNPSWSGFIGYRALCNPEDLAGPNPDHPSLTKKCWYFGQGKSVVTYPVSQGRFVNISAFMMAPDSRGLTYESPSPMPVSTEEVLGHYEHWTPQLRAVLQVMKNPTKWAHIEVKDLPTFISGRAAILGDAAHAMTPFLGSGFGQAIEDSITLAALLARVAHSDTPATFPYSTQVQYALHVYDEVRRPFAQHVQELSFQAGRIMQLDYCDAENPQSSSEDIKKVMQDMNNAHEWIWTTNAQDGVDEAVRRLDAKLKLDV